MRRGGPLSSTTRAWCDVASNQKKSPGSGEGGERAGAGAKGYAMGASGRQRNAAQVKSVPAPAHSRIHRWTPSKAIEHSRTGSRSPSRATSLPPVTGSSLGAAKPAKSNDQEESFTRRFDLSSIFLRARPVELWAVARKTKARQPTAATAGRLSAMAPAGGRCAATQRRLGRRHIPDHAW